MFEPPAALKCVEFRLRFSGGDTKPLLVSAKDSKGVRREIVVKLMNPEATRGHYGPTSLAAELICAAIARRLGLSVPNYYIAEVTREFSESVSNREVKEILRKNIGKNFGSEYQAGAMSWQAGVEHDDDQLSQLEDVLTLDSAFLNGDRKASKPNLLWSGSAFYLIDHSLAFPQEFLDPSMLFPCDEVREHCSFEPLSGSTFGRTFAEIFQRWPDLIANGTLTSLRAMIPAQWERNAGELDNMFQFLEKRPPYFVALSTQIREAFAS